MYRDCISREQQKTFFVLFLANISIYLKLSFRFCEWCAYIIIIIDHKTFIKKNLIKINEKQKKNYGQLMKNANGRKEKLWKAKQMKNQLKLKKKSNVFWWRQLNLVFHKMQIDGRNTSNELIQIEFFFLSSFFLAQSNQIISIWSTYTFYSIANCLYSTSI